VLQGRIRTAIGHLGAFELTVDAFAAPDPSSRHYLSFGDTRDGAISRADLVVDLSGGTPLFAAHDLRPGYLRADPGNPAAVAESLRRAATLVGTFDRPRYIDFTAEICAHSRNRITGCTRCLSLCPTGAIQPAGDSVAIDPMICAGCGQCAAACPTGVGRFAADTGQPRTLLFEHEGNVAIRRGDWKLVANRALAADGLRADVRWALHDLAADPAEQVDLAADRPDLVAELAAEFLAGARRTLILPGPR
jgi:ferredoxin